MDLEKKLKKLEDSIDQNVINVQDSDIIEFPIRLKFFELKGYTNLIQEIHRERASYETYAEKKMLIKEYKKIFLSQKKMYQRLLQNLINGKVKLLYPEFLKFEDKFIYEGFAQFKLFEREKSLDENFTIYLKDKLVQRINESKQELYKLDNYPTDYINTFSTFIGPSSVSKFRRDTIYYKDVFIAGTESNSYSIFYNENTRDETKNALLNILAYLNGKPSFYFTENYNFNRKLYDLYEQFDLLDMLRLRKKNFFDSKQEEPFYLELPILNQKNGYKMVCFEDSQHEMIFELYHASLKQFESLPRCVFLYRIIEYGIAKHYQPLFKPSDFTPEDALNYYVQEIMNHRYIPLFYADLGTYINKDVTKVVRKRKAKYVNFTTKLKEEAKKIIGEWKTHPYLQNKSVGKVIYATGRNAAAHGGSGRTNARYDYSSNYKHINNVNILLELIARYIIEKLNPELTNIVERRTKYYKWNSHYKVFEE